MPIYFFLRLQTNYCKERALFVYNRGVRLDKLIIRYRFAPEDIERNEQKHFLSAPPSCTVMLEVAVSVAQVGGCGMSGASTKILNK